MPVFLVPLHEYNRCHNPEGAEGGQFCATGGATMAAPNPKAHVIAPGEDADIHALTTQGGGNDKYRLFLFNPSSRELAIGSADPNNEPSHAEAAVQAGLRGPGAGYRYDRFNVHGYLLARHGKLDEIRISRVITADQDYDDSAAARYEQLGQVEELVTRLKAMGATADTRFLVYQWGGWPGGTLGEAFPEVFGKKRKPPPKAKRDEELSSFTIKMNPSSYGSPYAR